MTGQSTILIVDAPPESLALLTEILNAEGYLVRPADSGELALASIVVRQPDLILLDIHIPEIDGFEVCRQLKASEKTRDIPIIFISAATEVVERMEGFKLGAVDFITKPFQREECLARIRTQLKLSQFNALIEQKNRDLERANTQLRVELAERKQAEVALQESEERFSAFMSNLPAAAFVKDETGRALFANQYLQKLLAYRDGEGKTAYDLVAEEVQQQTAADDRKALAQGPIKIQETMLDWHGVSRTFETIKFPIRSEGKPVLLGGIALDITERKQAEEKVLAAQVELERLLAEARRSHYELLSVVEDQKAAQEQVRTLNAELERRVRDRTALLTAANQELEAFSYSVSHDLRSPLRAMEGFSAALLDDYAGQLDEQGLDYLSRIQEASRRMGQLITDLLDLSRVTRTEFARRRVDLSALAQTIAVELKAQAPHRMAEFEIAANLIVEGDPILLKTAMENLLQNAFKFTCKREQAVIQFGVMDRTGEPIYFVRDNGAGFDMTYAAKLFIPFQRLHGAKEYPGTGIGLTIVQRIIFRHGGRIWPEAAVDHGATFYFTLGGN